MRGAASTSPHRLIAELGIQRNHRLLPPELGGAVGGKVLDCFFVVKVQDFFSVVKSARCSLPVALAKMNGVGIGFIDPLVAVGLETDPPAAAAVFRRQQAP